MESNEPFKPGTSDKPKFLRTYSPFISALPQVPTTHMTSHPVYSDNNLRYAKNFIPKNLAYLLYLNLHIWTRIFTSDIVMQYICQCFFLSKVFPFSVHIVQFDEEMIQLKDDSSRKKRVSDDD